nr:MAG TPA: hypothetical protein [Caudoviricetes sp.]
MHKPFGLNAGGIKIKLRLYRLCLGTENIRVSRKPTKEAVPRFSLKKQRGKGLLCRAQSPTYQRLKPRNRLF